MRKRPINIIGGFYRDPNLHWSRQDTLNWIPVRAEQEGTLTPFQLRDAPGVKPFVRITKKVESEGGPVTIDVGPGRGIRNVEGKLFVVAAQTLYQISNTGVAIPFGTIPGVGRVSMAHNQFGLANQLITVNGSAGYVFNTNTQTLVKITDEGYPGAFIADYIDQYLAQVEPQGRFWFHSDLANGTDYNTLDRYEAEADPDRIVSLIVSHREVLVFGRDTIEPFVNTGGQTGTFERASNTVIEVGCAAKFTPRKLDNSVFWLDDKRLVRRLDGYTPIRVSTDAIDSAFAECTANQVATAYAFTWETRGHKVYYITVPGMFTFGYDVLTGQWHRRATWGMAHWDVIDLAFWNGKWIALSGQNGRLYELDQLYKLDRCDPLVRKRTTGKLWDAENEMTLNNVELKFQTGGPVSTCVLFPDQPEGPSLTGAAPDGLVGQPFSYSYAATPGDSPIARTVLREGSFVLQDGEPISFDQSGFSWNETTATISSPSPLEYFIRLVMRTYDQNGLYADHVDEFVIAELNNLLVTSSAGPGVPVFASAIAASAPTWTAIPTASGANITAHPAFWGGRWIGVGEGTLRYATTLSGPWSTAATPWPTDGPDTVVGGPAGWLVINDEFLSEGVQGKASQVPTDMAVYPMTVDGGAVTSLSMIAFTDGVYYADRAGGGAGTLLSSTDLATAWTKLCDSSTSTPGSSGAGAINRFYDIKAFDGALYASVRKGVTGLNELRRSDDGGATWPNVLISNSTDLLAPYQLETGNGVLVVYCWGGQNIYTSANDFAEPVATGIATNRAVAISEERIARQIAFGGGYFHIISGPFTAAPALGNKYITTMIGLEVSAPQSIPLTGSLRGIASDRIYDDE